MDAEEKYCSNCKKNIAASNFVMHEMHCRRHIVLCEHCAEPIPRAELDQHFQDVHAKIPCSQCQHKVEKSHLDDHLKSECPKRLRCCEFCNLSVPADAFSEHEEYCKTRTEKCDLCGRYIMLADRLRHETSSCTYPKVSPNENDRRQNVPHSIRHPPNHNYDFDPQVLEEMLRSFESDFSVVPDSTTQPVSVRNENSNAADDEMAPCEWCGQSLPVCLLVDHEENCLGSAGTGQNAGEVPGLNNMSDHYEPRRTDIPVINNLQSPTFGEETGADLFFEDGSDCLLPCEFCEQTFPAEMIFQHQVSCPMNGMATPRVATPASSYRPPAPPFTLDPPRVRRKQKPPSADDAERDLPRVRRKQRPPFDEEAERAAYPDGLRRNSNSAQRARFTLNRLLQEEEVPNPRSQKKSTNRLAQRTSETGVDSRRVMRELAGGATPADSGRYFLHTGLPQSRPPGSRPPAMNEQENDEVTPARRPRQRADHVFNGRDKRNLHSRF